MSDIGVVHKSCVLYIIHKMKYIVWDVMQILFFFKEIYVGVSMQFVVCTFYVHIPTTSQCFIRLINGFIKLSHIDNGISLELRVNLYNIMTTI